MIRLFSIAFLLIVWEGATSDFTLSNLVLGIIFILFLQYVIAPRSIDYRVNLFYLLFLVVFVLYELLISSLQVALDIVRFRQKSKPAMIEVPIHCETEMQLALLANLLSLTPGTLSVDISAKKDFLLVHVMFGQSVDSVKHFITHQLEKTIMKALPHV